MIDAFAVLSNNHVQGLLTNMIIRNHKPQESFIMRLVSHVSGYDNSPDESIINGMVDLCFHQEKFPQYLYTGDLYNRVLLALGSVVHKLARGGQIERATDIIDKVHSLIGLHVDDKRNILENHMKVSNKWKHSNDTEINNIDDLKPVELEENDILENH
ncbi:unnamed protein product [Mytilus edulis]|uniref:Uncharacterized protein n=1 Tax=Mytilus edulis TaxID=6550 RepID=A0A8S3S6B5_MYTED|nr:unnamed protein product [Mytilus edulis]